MKQLYKAELRRFARWALGLMVLHTAALFLLDRSFPWMRDDGEIAVVFGFAYAIAGAIFGVYQSAAYARPGHWIALLHRPLAPWKIMAPIHGASATVLFAAVSLPLLVFTAALTLQVGRVVDARHWPLALGGGLIALIGFGLGSYLALAPRRYGWTALVAASVLIISNDAKGFASLQILGLILSVLALLVLGAFKPDRSLSPSQFVLVAPTAGVAALGLYLLLVLGSGLVYQSGLALFGRNPETGTPPAGGLVEAWRAQSKDLFAAALAHAPGTEAANARAQLHGIEFKRLPVALSAVPDRGELTNAGPITFSEPGKGIDWTYSHDANAFLGLRLMDRRVVGELRPASAFEAPPILLGNGRMIAGGSMYGLESRTGRLERVFQLPAGEKIVAKPASVGAFAAILSDRALYFVDPKVLEGERVSGAGLSVPLGGMVGDLQRLDVALPGGRILVSFFFGRDSVEGPDRAWQRIDLVAGDGTARTIAQRTLGPDHSDVLRFRAYWLSPALQAITAAARQVGAGSAWIPQRAPIAVPRSVWIAALLLSLAAAAGTALAAARRGLGRAENAAWTLATLALGIPMFIAFCLVRERPCLKLH